MNCIICNSETNFFFEKRWEMPFKEFLNEAEFYKCENCGFTYSKTVFDMDEISWKNLNFKFHSYIEDVNNPKQGNQPPYFEQAFMIKILEKNNMIDVTSMVDYGGGMGTLEKILVKYFDLTVPIYDPYIKQIGNSDLTYIDSLKKMNVVYNSALFEHITKREDLDLINDCVSKDGVLIIHTVVCENIPKDPDWFYINPPVHSALHTNKSMNILMTQYGFISSLYCPAAKCWVMFRREPERIEDKIKKINQEFQIDYFIYKKGFVDFWKGF